MPRHDVVRRPLDLLGIAFWCGLLTGFAEVVAVFGRKAVDRRFVYLGPDAVWTTPLADGLLFALLGLVFYGAASRWRGPVARGPVVAGCAAIGCTTVFLLFPQLHRAASLLLGVGLGLQVGSLAARRAEGFHCTVRRTLPGLAAAVGLLALVLLARRASLEHHLFVSRAAPAPGAPNVLLIILDTVRSLNLSAYGYPKPTSPELERLARSGVRFDNAFSPSAWTLPSHLTLVTGRHLHQLGAGLHPSLDGRVPTLPELLRARGYATAGFVANARYVSWESGITRGFARFEDYPRSLGEAIQGSLLARRAYHHVGKLVELPPLRPRVLAADINRALLAWLDGTGGRPFFAFLNYLDAHDPYEPPDPVARRFGIDPTRREPEPDGEVPHTPESMRWQLAAYDAAIAHLDAELGRLFRELDRRGLLANTIVVVTSDHGEAFGEHRLIRHGSSVYGCMVRVPLLVAWPGRIPAGHVVTAPVSLRDVPATIAELARPGAPSPLGGRSLTRYWAGPGAPRPDTVITALRQEPTHPMWWPVSRGDLFSVEFDGVRYIRNLGDGGEELFDVRRDPGERYDLSRTERGRALLPRYRRALERILAEGSEAWRERTAEARRALRSGAGDSAAIPAVAPAAGLSGGWSPRPSPR
ncbi:MAG TPA: sulfatase [Gemmatimonadales bacterium]|nr:sulfatase [Gemmatimonadales bacterium]